MNTNYLNWIKHLDVALHGRDDAHILLFSSVCEPTDMLLNHFQQFQDVAREYADVSDGWGHPGLRRTIAARYGVGFDNVLTTNGASNGIFLTCKALLEEGDHVIVESPYYEPLMASPDYIGAEVSFIERQHPDYQIDPSNISSLIKPNTKLIILSNLHNPSAALIDDQTLLQIAQVVKNKNPQIKIIVDEIYHEFLPDIPKPAATLDECFITLNSLTKVYGFGIIHCGWIIADKSTLAKIQQLQIIVEGSSSRLLDSFDIFLFEHLKQYHERSLKILTGNYEILSQHLQPLIDKGIIECKLPKYGCICFPKLVGLKSADTLAQRLIDDYKLYVVPGRYFTKPEHIRIGFGSQPDKLKENLGIFVDAVTAILAK